MSWIIIKNKTKLTNIHNNQLLNPISRRSISWWICAHLHCGHLFCLFSGLKHQQQLIDSPQHPRWKRLRNYRSPFLANSKLQFGEYSSHLSYCVQRKTTLYFLKTSFEKKKLYENHILSFFSVQIQV